MRLIILLCFFSSLAQANPYGKKDGRWQFEVASEFLNTTENIDVAGDIVDLNNSGEFSETKTHLKVDWDFSQNFTIISDLILNSYESKNTSTSTSNSAPTDLYIGFDYLMYRSSFRVTPRVVLKIPLESYTTNVQEALGNDSSYDLDSRIYVSSSWQPLFLSAYAGFIYRSEGLSALLPFGAEVMYHGSTFGFGGGIKSSYSVINDVDTDKQTQRENFLQQTNSGSYRYYSLNPDATSAYGFARVYFNSDFYIGGGIEQSLFGKNTYYGTSYTAMLGMSFGGNKQGVLPPLKKTQTKTRKRKFRYRFEEAGDKDEDVFNNDGKFKYKEQKEETLDDLEKGFEIQLKEKKKK